jgi:hypothetical protein
MFTRVRIRDVTSEKRGCVITRVNTDESGMTNDMHLFFSHIPSSALSMRLTPPAMSRPYEQRKAPIQAKLRRPGWLRRSRHGNVKICAHRRRHEVFALGILTVVRNSFVLSATWASLQGQTRRRGGSGVECDVGCGVEG